MQARDFVHMVDTEANHIGPQPDKGCSGCRLFHHVAEIPGPRLRRCDRTRQLQRWKFPPSGTRGILLSIQNSRCFLPGSSNSEQMLFCRRHTVCLARLHHLESTSLPRQDQSRLRRFVRQTASHHRHSDPRLGCLAGIVRPYLLHVHCTSFRQ